MNYAYSKNWKKELAEANQTFHDITGEKITPEISFALYKILETKHKYEKQK